MCALRIHVNNFETTTNGDITNVATSIVLTSTTGLPSLSGGNYFYLTLVSGINLEIIKVTAWSVLTLTTVVRAQEGTTGFAFPSGSIASLRATADSLDRKADLNSPILITPALGTVASGNISACTSTSMVMVTPVLGTVTSGDISACTSTNMVLTTPKIGGIKDTNGNIALIISATANAVNYIDIINNSTGSPVYLLAEGPDTDINMILKGKGTGQCIFASTHASQPLALYNGTGYQHLTAFSFANTAASRTVTFPDADGTIAMNNVALGGTGVTTMTTAYAPVCAGTTATGALQVASGNMSNVNYVLMSNGASALPTWESINTTGGVTGPGSSTDNAVATWNSTGGLILRNTTVTIASGILTTPSDAVINTLAVGLGGATGGTHNSTNTALGVAALAATNNASATDNLAVGYNAGLAITTAKQVTCIGSNAGKAVTTRDDGVFIGYNAGLNVTSGLRCTAIGNAAFSAGTASDPDVTAIGYNAGKSNAGGGLGNNVFIGSKAASGASAANYQAVAIGVSTLLNCTGADNVAVGYLAGTVTTSANQSVIIGSSAGSLLTTPAANVILGYAAGTAIESGSVNLTTGAGNTLVGTGVCPNDAACANAIGLGRQALPIKATGTTSGTFGPGIAIGSASYPVGFRGNGTIIPSTTGGAGFWKAKLNGTQYYIPLFADASSTMTGSGTGGIAGTTSPIFVTPVLGVASATSLQLSGTGILDSNGNTMIAIAAQTSAVNYMQLLNAATGNTPTFQAAGSNTNIGISFSAKATGPIIFATTNSSPITIYSGTAQQHATTFTMANTANSRTVTFPDANGTVAFTGALGAASATSLTFSSTSGIIGTTTNDSAAAGSVGEVISSVIVSGSPTSLTTATNVDVTSISLTAGDWDVWGNITYIPGAGTTATSAIGWISSTSVTVPDPSVHSAVMLGGAVLSINTGFTVPKQRFSLSGTTTIYLSTVAVFAINTLTSCGGIYARRVR